LSIVVLPFIELQKLLLCFGLLLLRNQPLRPLSVNIPLQ